jgi:hypothetical protein
LVPDGGWLLIAMTGCALLVIMRGKLVEIYRFDFIR